MNQIIGINDWYFFPKVASVVVFQRIIGPAFLGRAPDEDAIARALPDGRLCVTGGAPGGVVRQTQIFDPVAEAWRHARRLSGAPTSWGCSNRSPNA